MNFKSHQFVATSHSTAEEKAQFANQFVKFVESDFDKYYFTQRFYSRLNNTFGHIAHFDRAGFWNEFFTTNCDKLRFFQQTASWNCPGSTAHTYSDVERAIQRWLKDEDVIETWKGKLTVPNPAAVLDIQICDLYDDETEALLSELNEKVLAAGGELTVNGEPWGREFVVPVEWTMYGTYKIRARNEKAAKEAVYEIEDLPKNARFKDDSFKVDSAGIH